MPPPTKKTPAVNDPLEGVKLETHGKMQEPEFEEPEKTEKADAGPVAAPEVIVPPAPAVVAKPSPKYRVKSKTTVSHFGQMLVLHPDDILSADSYGDEGLKRLLEAVPTEPV